MATDELAVVGDAARAVIEEAKAAGVDVFASGIHEGSTRCPVDADGAVSRDIYPGSQPNGGLTVMGLPSRDDAVDWARHIARARHHQELRELMSDPVS